MPFIVAHPGSLIMCESKEEAKARADFFRKTKHVKIYEIKEVAHCFPYGTQPDAPDPGPPGTPVAAAKAA
jgi:hypothetical protein